MFKARRGGVDGAQVVDAGTNWAVAAEMRWLGSWNNGRGLDALGPVALNRDQIAGFSDPAELGAGSARFRARAPLPKQQKLRLELLPRGEACPELALVSVPTTPLAACFFDRSSFPHLTVSHPPHQGSPLFSVSPLRHPSPFETEPARQHLRVPGLANVNAMHRA